ncbi:Crp/Fnr family transcriptional regulator [Parasphingorhabdus litoris]|uniref:Crp/Fnr family transcriptional regulator n=1 Tax=Parasphingorhabdus litoris TaxID=394733 RepID=UPI001E442BB3|nr:Crp/Fnr family transcriptional regulator [Parasphingorhabdus litoris]
MGESRQKMKSTFAAAGFVSLLPENVRSHLLEQGRVRRYEKGELILQRGDTAREFWFIESGIVQIGRYSVDGKLTLFALLGPGESFGEQGFLGDFPRMVDAIAGNDVKLIEIGEADLMTAIESDSEVARIMLKAMANMVQQAFDVINAGRNFSTTERVAQALLQLRVEENGDVAVPVTQQELSELVGVSRISLGKALEKLEADGIIKRRYGRIMVRDWSALLGSSD